MSQTYYGGAGSARYNASLEASRFPTPFFDMASTAMPADNTALLWSEFIFHANSVYRQSAVRLVSYFMTDISFRGATANDSIGQDESDKWGHYMRETLDVPSHEFVMGMDIMSYGNSFTSVLVPFKRMLACRCGSQYALSKMADDVSTFGVQYRGDRFHARCPKCKKAGVWEIEDHLDDRADKLILKRWSPHEMVIKHDLLTDQCKYFWKIPEEYKAQIRRGNMFELERCPKELLDAISKNQQLFEFADDQIFHAKEPTLAGMKHRGWGISRTMINFRQVWYVQLLHRYNEAIAADYVIPFRVLTPGSAGRSGQAGEPLHSINSGDFLRRVGHMVKKRRMNPTDWYTLPYPVQYQILGGEARDLAPKDLLEQGYDWMLEGLGVPIELRRSSMSVQTMPVSLRVFEASFHWLIAVFNKYLRWLAQRIVRTYRWENVLPVHERVTHADDMQKQMAILQMAAGGNVSLTTALRMLGLDNREEQRQIAEDSKFSQELQAKMQEMMQQAQFGEQLAHGAPAGQAGQQPGMAAPSGAIIPGQAGAAPPPGMGGAGPITSFLMQGGSTAMDPTSMYQIAMQLAQQLLSIPDQATVNRELAAAKQQNPTLHAAISQAMKDVRSQMRSQGQAQMMQQNFGTT